MNVLLLLIALVSAEHGGRCHAHEQRCELECNEDHPGGSMARMKCYERCQTRESLCRKDGSDEP